jgi:hypothetical protein
MDWYEATAKEYPIFSEVHPNLQDRVFALLYPRILVGRPRPIRMHPGGINAQPVRHEMLTIGSIPHDAIQHRANSSASKSLLWFTRFVAVTHPSTDCA